LYEHQPFSPPWWAIYYGAHSNLAGWACFCMHFGWVAPVKRTQVGFSSHPWAIFAPAGCSWSIF
jgi:hypothetical protein